MNPDLATMVQHKPAFRRHLAARPIEEKLALLDALRNRLWRFTQNDQAKRQTPGNTTGSPDTKGEGGMKPKRRQIS
jgi:hypothetical protein